MSEEDKISRIKIPEMESTGNISEFFINSGLEFELDKKKEFIDELLKEDSGSPFNKKKYIAPNREILYWAMVLGLREDNPIPVKNGSNTVPNDTFEKSKYCFWLGRVCGIMKNKILIDIFDPIKVRNAVQEYANGGIRKFFNYTMGAQAGADFIEGLMKLINQYLPEAIEIIKVYCPTEESSPEKE